MVYVVYMMYTGCLQRVESSTAEPDLHPTGCSAALAGAMTHNQLLLKLPLLTVSQAEPVNHGQLLAKLQLLTVSPSYPQAPCEQCLRVSDTWYQIP
jgi:hypothetical protein